MKQGFFNVSELSVSNNVPTIPRCGLCGLYRTCKTPRMKPTGEGRKGILIVAEAPGRQEDEKGIQLIGEAGQTLRNILRSINIKLDRDCWKTNSLICRPVNNKLPKNPQPLIDACRPNLMNTIKMLQPHTIILLGATACKSLIPVIWKDKVEEFSRWPGLASPSQKINCWVHATWHPSYLARQKNDLLELLTRNHLRQAFKHTKRPYETVPDYKSEIEVIHRPSQAAKTIRDIIRNGKECAFDYEANALKPEESGFEIVSCSICQAGKRTIAYPWAGESIDASVEFLKSPIGKIGANIKYESRLTKRVLGFNVNNWIWDTVIAAHCIDNRSGVTSVKFQSFALLGLEDYNSHIEPFLKSAKGKRLNRIRELPIQDVLLYNGMDSKCEYLIYKKQKQLMERITTE